MIPLWKLPLGQTALTFFFFFFFFFAFRAFFQSNAFLCPTDLLSIELLRRALYRLVPLPFTPFLVLE